MNLKYSIKDGRDIASFFTSDINNVWKNVFVDTLFNENVKIKNIKAIKQKLLKSKVNDQVILFVSGHALLDDSLDFYFASHNMDFDKPAKYGIPYNLLENLLDNIPARKKIMLIDACHSGGLDKDEVIADNNSIQTEESENVVSSYENKGGKNKTTKKRNKTGLQNSFELMQDLFTNLNKSSGSVVIAAAAGEGYALESAEWKNGAFTYSLLSGLKSQLADSNKNGEITVSEIKKYALKKVEKITNGKQKPTIRSDNLEFDFRVW